MLLLRMWNGTTFMENNTVITQKIKIELSYVIAILLLDQFSSVQPLSRIWLFATPWIAAHQASLSITNSQSPPKLMSIDLVMPSNHLTLSCPLLLLPSIFPSIRVFSNESALPIRWPKDWISYWRNWTLRKDPDAGKDLGQEEKGATEDEMVGWHHRLNGHELEQTPEILKDREALRAVVHGVTESDTTWQLNNKNFIPETSGLIYRKGLYIQQSWLASIE